MFTNKEYLKRRTPENGINRHDYIEHLVEEFHTTTNIEAQEQVSANLANFAYDPINWNYLKETQALQVFIELLTLNEHLQLYGSAGLCNICLDPEAYKFIIQSRNCSTLVESFLKAENKEIILNYITLFYQLLNVEKSLQVKQLLVTPQILKKICSLRQDEDDQRLVNLATVFLEDFGTKIELVELPPTIPASTKNANAATQPTL